MSLFFGRRASSCRRRGAGLVLVAALALAGSMPPAASAGSENPVQPHRAIYDLRLAPGGARDFADVSGELAFEWADSCDGWSVTQRSRMLFEYRSGLVLELGWSLTSWEAKDGLSYRFQLKNYENGEVVEELRGEAALDGDGGSGEAVYSKPSGTAIALPAGTLFPTVHSLALIEAALAGKDSLWAVLFDGTSEISLYDVSALVLPRGDGTALSPMIDPALVEGLPAWRVDLAFYDHDSQASEPTHEQTVWMFGNGIVDRMSIDYGDFRIDGKLKRFELLPEPVC
jgi:hypothetical protein